MLHTPIQTEIVNVESSSQEFIQLTQNTRPSRTPSIDKDRNNRIIGVFRVLKGGYLGGIRLCLSWVKRGWVR